MIAEIRQACGITPMTVVEGEDAQPDEVAADVEAGVGSEDEFELEIA